MWEFFLAGLAVLCFIDLARWITSQEYGKPNIFNWMFSCIWQNAFCMFVLVLIIKLVMWVFGW